MPDTKLVPSFLQLLKPCIAHHSQGSSHWFSTHLSFLHGKQTIFFQQISATIRSQLCVATVPKGSLLSVSLRSLFEGWFIGCLWEDWGRASFFFFFVFSFEEFFFQSDAPRNAYCSMQCSLWDGENITVKPSVEKIIYFNRKTLIIFTERILYYTTVLPKHMQQIHLHIAHLYLEMKSDTAFFPGSEGFLPYFSATNVCQSSYPVSLFIFLNNFENCSLAMLPCTSAFKTNSSVPFFREGMGWTEWRVIQ